MTAEYIMGAAIIGLLATLLSPIIARRVGMGDNNGETLTVLRQSVELAQKRFELQQSQVETISSTLMSIGLALTNQALNYREDMKDIRNAHQQTAEALRIILDRMDRRDRVEHG